MTFLYPLGLLGLIGVPVVILIYILRNKYNEQTIPSTYLWHLSEKFFKHRNPLSGLTGLIGLILQILTVIAVSLAISRPVFVIPASANEYCFILDASGSMNMQSGNSTRFKLAKKELENKIEDANAGSTYTLILVSTETTTVYERLTDKKLALDMLQDVACSEGNVDYAQSLSAAQNYFDENPSFLVYLFTDKAYTEHNNVKIVNFGSEKDVNYALSDVSGQLTGSALVVDCTVTSYGADASLDLELYIDDNKKAAQKAEVAVKAGEPTPVRIVATDVKTYDSFRVVVKNDDCLSADNEIVHYNQKSESSYNILIVSETPFFLQAAFDVLTDSKVDTVTPDDYKEGDYGLYVFHSFTPDALPDAAVWLINSTKSVGNSGFGIRGVIELDEPEALVKSDSTATAARKLLEGIDGRNVFISEYVKYSGMYTKFTTLFSYNANPLIFAGVNALGNREVVFGFDLHKADFSLSSDFAPLIGNLLAYSCPDVLDRTDYVCGEEASINITANVKNVKAISPDGEEIYIDASTDIGSLRLEKVGTYTVELLVSGEEKSYKIYSGAPVGESNPAFIGESFSLIGEQEFEKSDGEYDPLFILFILIALLFVADWMVYCYEKYQLR